MIALTSISPRHHIGEAQLDAVKSWIKAGFEVVSINAPEEIAVLKDQYPVKFVECHRTMRGLFKAPYVPISAFIDYAKEHKLEQVMLINSDIFLVGKIEHYWQKASEGLVFSNRYDHDNFENPKRYDLGFDVFIINQSFYHVITQSMFSMGQTWWDYWLPYRFIKENIPVYLVKEALFFHQLHPVQYSDAEWRYMTKHFQWMETFMQENLPQRVNNAVYTHIKKHAQWL